MTRPKALVIDPGHGGHDPGAVGFIEEKDAVLEMSLILEREIHRGDPNIPCYFTRRRDEFVSLQQRTAHSTGLGFRKEEILYVSVHMNSFSSEDANGFEIWTTKTDTLADPYATRIFERLEATTLFQSYRRDDSDGDPDKEANFYVLRNVKCPAVLLEMGFVTNGTDAANAIDPTWVERAMSAVADGILGTREEINPPTAPITIGHSAANADAKAAYVELEARVANIERLFRVWMD